MYYHSLLFAAIKMPTAKDPTFCKSIWQLLAFGQPEGQ